MFVGHVTLHPEPSAGTATHDREGATAKDEPQRKDWRDVPRAEFDDAFRHIAAEIGFFARAWNALHNNLATIFAVPIITIKYHDADRCMEFYVKRSRAERNAPRAAGVLASAQ
jgi:hypothetical protein